MVMLEELIVALVELMVVLVELMVVPVELMVMLLELMVMLLVLRTALVELMFVFINAGQRIIFPNTLRCTAYMQAVFTIITKICLSDYL